jgi:uncharacterized protein with HEPN domain
MELIRTRGPRSREELEDAVLEAATLHWLEIIGEAANRLSEDLRAAHPEVPWRAIIDFRNLLAHGYDYVLLDRVWQVIAADLPSLEGQVRAILAGLR